MSSPDLPFRSVLQRTSNEEETNSFINTVQIAGLGTATKRIAKKSKSMGMKSNSIIAQTQFSASTGSVESSSERSTSASQQDKKQVTVDSATEAVVSEIVFMPMKSFVVQESSMKLTANAAKLYSLATTEEAAKKFIKAYGSHIPFGAYFDLSLFCGVSLSSPNISFFLPTSTQCFCRHADLGRFVYENNEDHYYRTAERLSTL